MFGEHQIINHCKVGYISKLPPGGAALPGREEGALEQVAGPAEPISRQVARQEYAAGALFSAPLGSARHVTPRVIVGR